MMKTSLYAWRSNSHAYGMPMIFTLPSKAWSKLEIRMSSHEGDVMQYTHLGVGFLGFISRTCEKHASKTPTCLRQDTSMQEGGLPESDTTTAVVDLQVLDKAAGDDAGAEIGVDHILEGCKDMRLQLLCRDSL